jgi:seryl-tRNA synthetase
MIHISTIREQPAAVAARLAVKNFDGKLAIQSIIELDQQRRNIQQELDAIRAQSNQLAAQIGSLIKLGNKAEAEELKAQTTSLKEKSKEFDEAMLQLERQIAEQQVKLPNMPATAVPEGKSPADNVIKDTWGKMPEVMAGALPHWEIAAKYDLIDFELGVKIAGAGFPVYKGKGAKLQRALINFFLDQATLLGYKEVQPPIVVNADSGYGTGNLPDKEGQMYHIGIDDLYLIPTAEVPLTNIFRKVTLKETELPIKITGYTPCFRREAGSYGKDVRGLNRLHQFDKVEIVQIAHPENSYHLLEEMRTYVGGLLQKLGLHYRTLLLCGGDMSFSSAMTYDFEVYSAAQERWLEVSSVSNFETFQSVRMDLKFKDTDGKNQYAHTLNGSALALPRIVAALLENNQTVEGIVIPEVLQAYTGFSIIN